MLPAWAWPLTRLVHATDHWQSWVEGPFHQGEYSDGAFYVNTCPGCLGWQIEYTRYDFDVYDDVKMMLLQEVAGHRAECPAFDMLAGFAGIPASGP